jgi:hypothetical protein
MELSKYLILRRNGEPQAVTFPRNVKHLHIWDYIHREDPHVELLSAGSFLDDPGSWWHGGESKTLKLKSSPENGQIIHMMIHARDRRDWDLRVIVWEACEEARRNGARLQTPEMSMSF